MPLYSSIISDPGALSRDLILTLRHEWLQRSEEIHCRCVANRLESIVIGNVDMRTKIVGSEAQTDD